MKLAYVEMEGRRSVAVVKGNVFVDLSRTALRWEKGLTELLASGPDGLALAQSAAAGANHAALVDPAAVTYLRLNEPQCITCVGSNYAAHIRERGRPFPKEPSCFMKTLSSFVAHRQPIERPGELGAVRLRGGIGHRDRPGRTVRAGRTGARVRGRVHRHERRLAA